MREIGRFIARAYIAGDWFVNFADASAVLSPQRRADLPLRRAVGDETLRGFGACLAAAGPGETAVRGSFGWLGRVLPALFALEEIAASAGPASRSSATCGCPTSR